MALPFQGKPRVPRKAPPSPPPEKKLSKPGFFGSSGSVPLSGLVGKFTRASSAIPGTSAEMGTKEKEELAKRFTYGKHGPDIGPDDARSVVDKLKEDRYKTKTYEERQKIDRAIRWLKKTTDTS